MQKVYVFSGYRNNFSSAYNEFGLATNPEFLDQYFTEDTINEFEEVSVTIGYIKYQQSELQIPSDNGQELLVISEELLPAMKLMYFDKDRYKYYYLPENLPTIAEQQVEIMFIFYLYNGMNYINQQEISDELNHYQHFNDKMIMWCEKCNVFYNYVCEQHPEQCYLSLP